MSEMSFDDMVDGLVRLGTDPENARRLAARQLGLNGIDKTRFERPAPAKAPAPAPEIQTPTIELPFRVTIPWSELCSDNEKSVPYIRRVRGGNVVPGQKRSPRYDASFRAIKKRARAIADDRLPIDGIALEMHARIFLPPARRNDAINFSKCTNDALEGVVYMNDNQLHRQTWERAGIDIDAPRAEITITRLIPQRLTKAA